MTLRAQLAAQLPMDSAERVAECRWFQATGTPPHTWAARLHTNNEALATTLRRAGATDLFNLLDTTLKEDRHHE